MTLYRVADKSKVVDALIEAAENGKEVVVMVELRARFDEQNNIEMSRRLEDAGCRIIYGLDKYKVHSKLCLITRKTEDGFEYITQIGTGKGLNTILRTGGLHGLFCPAMVRAIRFTRPCFLLQLRTITTHIHLHAILGTGGEY